MRNALLALGTGLLVMAGLASLSTFWAPTRAWWDAAEHGSALAAGAMLFVVSHEIIPETHRNGFETLATGTLLAGFVFMLLLDATLN